MDQATGTDYASKGYGSMADYLRYSTDATAKSLSTPTQTIVNQNYADPNAKNIQLSTNGMANGVIPTPPTTLSSTSLTPTAPVTLPAPTVSTTSNAGAGIQGTAEGTNASLLSQIDQQRQADQAKVDAQQTSVEANIAKLAGKGDAQIQAEADAGISDKTKLYTDITNEYNTKQLAFKRQQEAILATPGITREQANQQIAEVGRLNNQELADIAIRQSVASNDLSTAQNLVNHKIDLQFGSLKDTISYQMQFLSDNKANLSKDEQNLLQLQIDQNTKAYNEGVTTKKTLEDTKLKALQGANELGAPQSVQQAIQAATTPEDVIRAAGSYGGGLDAQYKRAQISKMYSDNQVLSIADAKALGVPYGTTKGQAITLGKVPGQGSSNGVVQLAQDKANIDQISELVGTGLAGSAVGTSPLTRTTSGFFGTVGKLATVVGIPSAINSIYQKLTGKQQDFIAGVEQLRSSLNLDTLIKAKANGATFGALSDQELQVLASSATKLGTWAIKDGGGNVVGYDTSESSFKKELDKVNNFAKLDYIVKGGDPVDVGAKIMPDGSVWVVNSDGTKTQLK